MAVALRAILRTRCQIEIEVFIGGARSFSGRRFVHVGLGVWRSSKMILRVLRCRFAFVPSGDWGRGSCGVDFGQALEPVDDRVFLLHSVNVFLSAIHTTNGHFH